MKKFLYLNLLIILTTLWTVPSVAKKYRYIKREHGVKFEGNIPTTIPPIDVSADFKGAYAYNWKGFVEVGPYFKLSLDAAPLFNLSNWSVGLMGEYNFIKNRGRRKFIPSLGLQLGVMSPGVLQDAVGLHAVGGVHASFKWFVATRTAFITTAQYSLVTPFAGLFSSFGHQIDLLSMGFSYYFDFH